jgi:cell division protein FtsW
MARPSAGIADRARSALQVRGESTPEFWLLAGTIAVLTVLGLVMTFSASFVQSASDTGDAFGIFQRQLMWCALGLPVMAVAAVSDYRGLRKIAIPALIVSLILAALVLIPGLGVKVHGARRWFSLGPISMQPSELLKLTVPIAIASILAARWPRLRAGDLRGLLLPAVPILVVASGLVMAGPDLETAALIIAIGGTCLYAAGLPLRIIFTGLATSVSLALVAIVSTPFRRARIEAWLDPMSHSGTFGYQTVQGFIALGSGGVFGRGLGQGRGQWLYIPNAHTDFIFAIIGEELGLVGALFVLLLFVALAIGGIRTAKRAPDPFGRLVATAITGWLLYQGAMNMGSVVGLLPVTGVTLPLVSFGGSSLVVTMLALGILLSIARHGRPVSERSERSSGRREGGRPVSERSGRSSGRREGSRPVSERSERASGRRPVPARRGGEGRGV